METDLNTLIELLQKAEMGKNRLDTVSSLSVPILSLTALIITTIFSFKQWYIMKCEYRLKLYPERYDIYKGLIELLHELQQEGRIVGDKYKIQILKIENKMFLYDTAINNIYQELKHLVISVDPTKPDFDRSQYTNQFTAKLSKLIEAMKKYLLKKHIDIA